MIVGHWKNGTTKKKVFFALWPRSCSDGTIRVFERLEVTHKWCCGFKGHWSLDSVLPVPEREVSACEVS